MHSKARGRPPPRGAAISAPARWPAPWGGGALNGRGSNAPPPIMMPGPNPPLQFPVGEIQSVNGG